VHILILHCPPVSLSAFWRFYFTRIILTSYLYPGILVLMETVRTCTAFKGSHRFASGSVAEVALAIRDTEEDVMFLVFDDTTGRPIDIDTRGTIR
jgi:hypothetical protein